MKYEPHPVTRWNVTDHVHGRGLSVEQQAKTRDVVLARNEDAWKIWLQDEKGEDERRALIKGLNERTLDELERIQKK